MSDDTWASRCQARAWHPLDHGTLWINVVTLKADGSRAQLEEVHHAVMAASPNHFNLCQPVQMCGRQA